MDIARVHIRFYQAGGFLRGHTMVDWVTNLNAFGMYKRMWCVKPPMFMKVDGPERINILKDCAFLTFTPVGIGLSAMTGDLDAAIAASGLELAVSEDLPKLLEYARAMATPGGEKTSEIAFLTAWDQIEPLQFRLAGVVHTDQRLRFAITSL